MNEKGIVGTGLLTTWTESRARRIIRIVFDPIDQSFESETARNRFLAAILAAKLVGRAPQFSTLSPEEKREAWDELRSKISLENDVWAKATQVLRDGFCDILDEFGYTADDCIHSTCKNDCQECTMKPVCPSKS